MNQKASGEERLAAICQTLRQETLTPAQQEAESILLAARREAENILHNAKKDAEELKANAKKENKKEKALFHASLKHAALQVVETMKGEIEHLLFNRGLELLVQEQFRSTKDLASVLTALTHMIEKEGIAASPEVWIGSKVDKKALIASLAQNVLSSFSEETIKIGSFLQGFKLLIKDKHMSIEITEESIKELLSSVLRRDFRKYLFQEQGDTELAE